MKGHLLQRNGTKELRDGSSIWIWNGNRAKERLWIYFHIQGSLQTREEVYVKGLFRVDEPKNLTILANKNIEFKIYDSMAKELHKKETALNSYGSTSFSFKIPEEAPTGYYRITAKIPKEWKF